MDCKKLHSDIERLKSLRDELSSKLESATESGVGKIALSNLSNEASGVNDKVLEDYLDDFYENNQDIFEWKLGERIKGFEDADGCTRYIDSIAPLPDGSVMVGGWSGTLYHATKDQNGKYRLGDIIEGFEDADGNIADLESIALLPDGSVMVGGGRGALYRATKDQNGKYKLGDIIEGFEDADGDNESIYSIAPLSDCSVMIGGSYGALYHATKDQNGKYKLEPSDRIKGFEDADGDIANIRSIAPLPDGSVMIGGDRGALYRATKDQNGKYRLGDIIEGFEDAYGNIYTNIYSIAPLPDGSVMVGGWSGALYHATKDQNGKYKLGDIIEGFEDAYGNIADLESIAPLPDGSVMIGGGGALYHATNPKPTLSNLKKSLPKIAEKR